MNPPVCHWLEGEGMMNMLVFFYVNKQPQVPVMQNSCVKLFLNFMFTSCYVLVYLDVPLSSSSYIRCVLI